MTLHEAKELERDAIRRMERATDEHDYAAWNHYADTLRVAKRIQRHIIRSN